MGFAFTEKDYIFYSMCDLFIDGNGFISEFFKDPDNWQVFTFSTRQWGLFKLCEEWRI